MMASTTELKALEDINCILLTTGRWSDVTLVVGEKTAAAHKLILASRSPVFEALFAELSNAENRVEIDVQADVLDHFLAFIYAGKVPALEPKMAQDLLAAAEKYKVEQLKSIAEDYLCVQVCPESVVSLLLFAEAVNASNLKAKCLELLNSLASPSVTPRPLPPIARLHDPCLIALFRQLPPVDQMTARTVCHRWSDLVPYAARSTRSLTILSSRPLAIAQKRFNRLTHGSHWKLSKLARNEGGTPLFPMHSLTKWNSLQFNTLDEQTVTAITATFPVLKELQLSGRLFRWIPCCSSTPPPPSLIDPLIRLLEHCRPQLITLTLDFYIDDSHEPVSSCYRLGVAINSLYALKNLCLDFELNQKPHCPHLSILPQLTQFTSNLMNSKKMLNQYDPLNLPALVHISYNVHETTTHRLTSLNEDIRRRFVRIDELGLSDYRTICPNFLSLTSAALSLPANTTFRDFLVHASKLTQLVFLDMHYSTFRPDDQPHLLLPQLKSIKLLRLGFINSLKCHRDLEPLNLAWTMPNVQVIEIFIDPFQCATCSIPRQPRAAATRLQKMHCLCQMFAPLKRNCAQLHTIKHNREKSLGTAEEILAAEPIIKLVLPPVAASDASDHSMDENSDSEYEEY